MQEPAKGRSSSSSKMYINAGQEDQMVISGFKLHKVKEFVTWVFIILTVGLLRLVFYWRPDFMLKCTCDVASLAEADFVLLKDHYNQIFVEKVKLSVASTESSKDDLSTNSSDGRRNKKKVSEVVLSVKVTDTDENQFSADGKNNGELSRPLLKDVECSRYFMNKKIKYVWSNPALQFKKLRGLDEGLSCSYFHETQGLSQVQQTLRQEIYGTNSIVVHVTPIIKLLFTQALDPFYIFQLFSITLWYIDEYAYYASCIVVISAISLTAQIYETRSMQRALKHTLTPTEIVTVCRGDTGEYENIPSDLLVPGDIIEVPRQGCIMQCDAVLVNGNCIVNESMLTGESVPVTKTPIPNNKLSSGPDTLFIMTEHSRHVLFCGTHVIQTRYYGNQRVRAVVIRTGFSTAKGELVRSILFPKPVDFKFSQDAFKFIGVLALIAMVGMIYTIVLMVEHGEDTSRIIIRSLDLITIVIPPALPAAMTIGIVFAQKRLKRQKIFCISPRSINLCGAINTFCFDKTGTLTEEGLDMNCVVPVSSQEFQSEEKDVTKMSKRNAIVVAMATCHSLTIIEEKITGDPLDLKMFEATKWELEEPGEDNSKYDVITPTIVRPKSPDLVNDSAGYDTREVMPYEVGILRQFTFSSKLQRMSVITRELGSDHFDLYAKGSPEMIASLCDTQTVPSDFHDTLMYYTQQGYRVIGLAHRPLTKLSYVKIQRVQRDLVECDLTFLGLIILENRLKPETTPVIRILRDANIRTIMVTGDNMLTALSVARECEIIERQDKAVMVTVLPPSGNNPPRVEFTHSEDTRHEKVEYDTLEIEPMANGKVHLTMTGKSWALVRKYFPELLPKIAVRGTVFSRFLPEQKQQLVELLQEVGYYVGMCGDGANDCGALKTAHTGISLSEAESSVASPFTSKEPNISCVPNVIKEGRAALVTSFGIFKFMAGYSMTQFLSVCLLYWISANFTDFTFLYVDLILLTTLGITFCYTGAYPILGSRPPKVSLIAITPILSLIAQLLVNLVVQVSTWKYTTQQPWFDPFVPNDENNYQCHEVTVVFCISSFQYITLSVVFSKGSPYRRTIFSNYLFIGNILVCSSVTAYIVMYPMGWLENLLELVLPPSMPFRALIVGMAIVNFFLCFIVETYFMDFLVDRKCLQPMEDKYVHSKLKYRVVESEICCQPDWPPLTKSRASVADMMRLEQFSAKEEPAPDYEESGIDSKAFVKNDEENTAPCPVRFGEKNPSFVSENGFAPSLVSQVSVDSSISLLHSNVKSSSDVANKSSDRKKFDMTLV